MSMYKSFKTCWTRACLNKVAGLRGPQLYLKRDSRTAVFL